MTCSEFRENVDLLSVVGEIDDVTRQRTMKHGTTCADCAVILSNDRILSSGLAALADKTKLDEAPVSARAALLEAFREQHDSGRMSEKVVEFPARRHQHWAIVAVAASVLALAALTWQLSAFITSEPETLAIQALPATPPPVPPAEIDRNMSDKKPDTDQPAINVKPGSASRRRSTRRIEAKPETSTEQAAFIPLTYISDTASVRSGTVVRVEVQRATLVAMGLPVNAARKDSLIRADLVVGDDGVARAIRFVE